MPARGLAAGYPEQSLLSELEHTGLVRSGLACFVMSPS